MNLRTEIRNRAFALTEAIDTIADLSGERERTDPPAADELPFYVLRLEGHGTSEDVTEEQSREIELFADLYVAAVNQLEASEKLDALWAAVVNALQSDLSLGGLVEDIREVRFEIEREDERPSDQDYWYGDTLFHVIAASGSADVNSV